MSRSSTRRFGWVLVAALGLWAAAAPAQELRYRYVSLDEIELPPGFLFFDPVAINNSGRIYGNAYECFTVACDSFLLPHVAIYADGVVTVLQPGLVNTVNEGNTMAGSVLVDPANFIEQAALFRGDQVELVPRQPGEFSSAVTALNDSGMALVTSFDANFQPTYVLYKNGLSMTLDFGPTVTNPFRLGINNQGIVSGTQGITICDGATGFRFDTRTGATTLLHPLSTKPAAWGLDINNRGDVLGYSFVCGGVERIGVWDGHGKFRTYFVGGTPEFPTISNELQFNDNNLIVITLVSSPASDRMKSYVVPKPGVRLDVADLVGNLPAGVDLSFIRDINNHGDMIGFGFLLKRIGSGEH